MNAMSTSNVMERNIERIVQGIEQISTLPIISNQIHDLLLNENVSIRQIGEIVEKDPPLAVKVLKIVNSAFYGLLNNVSSIDHALVILGLKEVKNIVLAFSIQKFFSKNQDTFDRKKFWKHSIICSQVSKNLTRHFNLVDEGTFLLSGLIHDIGKLVTHQYFHEDFKAIIDVVASDRCTFSEAEKKVMGVTHYQIAAKLLQQWNFPKKVIMPIFYHHAPWYDKNFTSDSIILFLSNILTNMSGYPCFEYEKQTQISDVINPSVLDFLNKNGFDLDQESFEIFIQNINEFISSEKDKVMGIFD